MCVRYFSTLLVNKYEMAKHQHSKGVVGDERPRWSDEVRSHREGNKNTVKDLIHLYDKKENITPTQDQESNSGNTSGGSSTHSRQGNYYSEEPTLRQGNKSVVRRQHSHSARHTRQPLHSYHSERQGSLAAGGSSHTTGLPPPPSHYDVGRKRSSLASKSWATPDDVTAAHILTESTPITQPQERVASSGFKPRTGEGPRGAVHYSTSSEQQPAQAWTNTRAPELELFSYPQDKLIDNTQDNRLSKQDNTLSQQDNRRSQQNNRLSQQDQRLQHSNSHWDQRCHNDLTSQSTSQQDSRNSQTSRSRSVDKRARDNPSQQTAPPKNVHSSAVHSRARSQSPGLHLAGQGGRSSRGQSPITHGQSQIRTPRSSSTPRHIKEQRDSLAEQKHHVHTTPPPGGYNRQSLRSRSQSPHVNRKKDVSLSQSMYHTQGSEPQSNQVKRHSIQPQHSRSHSDQLVQEFRLRPDHSQNTEHYRNTSHVRSQSPHVRHHKQSSNVSSSASTSQVNTADNNYLDRVTSVESVNHHAHDKTILSQSRHLSHQSISPEHNMRSDQRSNHKNTVSHGGTNSQGNQERAHQGRTTLQRKPPVKTQQMSEGQNNMTAGQRGARIQNENLHKHQDYTQTGHIDSGRSLQARARYTASNKQSDRLNASKDYSARSSHGNVKERPRERQRGSPQHRSASGDRTLRHKHGEGGMQDAQLSYAQLDNSSRQQQSHQRSSSQSSISNTGSDSSHGRGSHPSSPKHHRGMHHQHTPSPSYEDRLLDQQQRGMQHHHNTPSPTYRDSPTSQQEKRLENQNNTPSPTLRKSDHQHTPSPSYEDRLLDQQQRGMQHHHNTTSPTYRDSPISHQEKRLGHQNNTPSPTLRNSPMSQPRKRLEHQHNTPSPTQRDSPTSRQEKGQQHQHNTPSRTYRDSPTNQQQRDSPQSIADSIGDEYLSLGKRPVETYTSSQKGDSKDRLECHTRASPQSHDTVDRESPNPGNYIQTYTLSKPAPRDEEEDFLPGSFIQTYSLTKPARKDQEAPVNSGNYVQTYSLVNTVSQTEEANDESEHFIQTYSLSKPPAREMHVEAESFVQTYSITEPSIQDTHIERYTIGGKENAKTFVESYSTKPAESSGSSRLSDLSKALLGRSSNNQSRATQLKRSQSADMEKMLSGPREKWNIQPPAPCGNFKPQRQMSDETLIDPTYSYVNAGQVARDRVYPGEGVYSEPQVSQLPHQHVRHASYDSAMGGTSGPGLSAPGDIPFNLHYMSRPLFPPDYEVIHDSEVDTYAEPLKRSDRKRVSDETANVGERQGEIMMDDDDNVSYLEPVSLRNTMIQSKPQSPAEGYRGYTNRDKEDETKMQTHQPADGYSNKGKVKESKLQTQQSPEQYNGYSNRDKTEEHTLRMAFEKETSPDVNQVVRSSDVGNKPSRSRQSRGKENVKQYNIKQLSVPTLDTTVSSSHSGGSGASPDSTTRSYTAMVIGGKLTTRQVTLLASTPAQYKSNFTGISEDVLVDRDKFESDLSGVVGDNSFQPSGAVSEDDDGFHMTPVVMHSHGRKGSRDRTMSLHSASSLPDLQEIGLMRMELRRSSETVNLIAKQQENLKSEMSKSFELLYKQQQSQQNRTKTKADSNQYEAITIHRVFKHVAQSVPVFNVSRKRLLGELFRSYPSWFVQWMDNQIAKETRIEKECIHECLVQWQDFQGQLSDVELMAELKRVLQGFNLPFIVVGIGKILAKDSRNRKHCIEFLDDRLLTSLANEIGNEWRSLGIYLGFTFQELQQLESNHHKNVRAAIQEMLIVWKNRDGPNVNILVKGFAEVQRMDLVERLRPVFISGDVEKTNS